MGLSLEFVTNFILENLENVTITKGGRHFNARCPFCGDSKKSKRKKRFHVDYESENNVPINCFNGGCDDGHGNFYKLYGFIKGISSSEAYKRLNKYQNRNISELEEILRDSKGKKKEKKERESHNYILDDCISADETVDGFILKQYQKVLNDFIENRKVKENVFISYKGEYKNRIIIPIYDEDGDIIFFQGRAINEKLIPKYMNPPVEKEHIILNNGKFNKEKYIGVTEGILDAYTMGNQCTTIIGKEFNIKFKKKIEDYTEKGIILIMDNDKDGIFKLKQYINMYKDNLLYFIMPYKYIKDLNQLSVEKDIEDMYNFVLQNSYPSSTAVLKL